MEPTATPIPDVPTQSAHDPTADHPADRVRIVSTPGICGGRPRIDGHRIQVEDIAIWHERMGMSPDEIVSEYPSITLADVHAALAYYYENRQRIDADIEAAKRYAEEMRTKAPPSLLQEELRGKGRPMARTIRFHLDENCSKAIAGGLRRRGIDITTTPEAGLVGALDEQQVAHCLGEHRVLFTQDQDFLRLDAAGIEHAGIAFCAKDTKSIGEIIQRLVLIWEVYDPEEFAGRVEYL